MDKSVLMEKVIAGKASPEEQKEFDYWLSLSNENREEFEHVKWLTENADNTERDPDDPFYDGWKQIKNRMISIQKKKRIVRMIKISIGILLVLVLLYFVFHQLGSWNSSLDSWSSKGKSSQTLAATYFLTNASDSQI